MFMSLCRALRRACARTPYVRPENRRRRLQIESLEERTVLDATFASGATGATISLSALFTPAQMAGASDVDISKVTGAGGTATYVDAGTIGVDGADYIDFQWVGTPSDGAQANFKVDLVGTGNMPAETVHVRFNAPPIAAALQTTITVCADDAVYNALPYNSANDSVITTLTLGAVGTTTLKYYSDAAGTNEIAAPTNVGTYYVQAFFASSDLAQWTDSESDIVAFNITAKTLGGDLVSASTQSALNISKAGTIDFAINLGAGALEGNDTVLSTFNGAKFTLCVAGNAYSIEATATVDANGVIHVGWRMSAELQALLLGQWNGATSAKTAGDLEFSLHGTSADGNYEIDTTAMTRLFLNGKLTF